MNATFWDNFLPIVDRTILIEHAKTEQCEKCIDAVMGTDLEHSRADYQL